MSNIHLPYKHTLVTGDWSDDGHGKKDFYSFDCSHNDTTVKQAYFKAVEKCGISLHHNDWGREVAGIIRSTIFTEYQSPFLLKDERDTLSELGVKWDRITDWCITAECADSDETVKLDSQQIAELFFEMVGTQIDGFEYRLSNEKMTLNGYWSEDFNFQIGYGANDYE